MSSDEFDKALLNIIRQKLDAGADQLDDHTLTRLKKARTIAIEAAEKKRSFFNLPRLATARVLATIAVILTTAGLWFTCHIYVQTKMRSDDMEVATSMDHIQMYKDLDFYQWLAETDHAQ